MQIVNFIHELARQHKQINGFIYGKGYEKGAANEAHPLIWLDDPIYGQTKNNAITYTLNIDILGIPENDKEVLSVQSSAFMVGLQLAERIKQTRASTGISIDEYSFLSLRDYYDNKAAGVRFTYYITMANPVERCVNNFDIDKEFPKIESLPVFKVDNPNGCAIFSNKSGLPNFKIGGR